MSLISRNRSRVRDDFIVKTKVGQGQQGKVPSRGARRGLERIMLREDYVEDKSIFELKEHTGVCPTYIVQSLSEKRTKDFPSLEGIKNISGKSDGFRRGCGKLGDE